MVRAGIQCISRSFQSLLLARLKNQSKSGQLQGKLVFHVRLDSIPVRIACKTHTIRAQQFCDNHSSLCKTDQFTRALATTYINLSAMDSCHRVHQESPTDTEGRKSSFVLDHFLPAMPTHWNEFGRPLKGLLHYVKSAKFKSRMDSID